MGFTIPSRAITAPDPDASKVPAVQCSPGVTSLSVGMYSDTPNATAHITINWTDPLGNYLGSMGPISLVCEKVAGWAGHFRAFLQDGSEPVYHVGGYWAYVQVLDISGGNWTLVAGSQ